MGSRVVALVVLCLCVFDTSLTASINKRSTPEIFNPGSYEYDYTSVVENSAVGTTDRVSAVRIKCTVVLGVVGDGKFNLKTNDCSLDEIPSPGKKDNFRPHPKSGEFKNKMQQNPVYFELHDGEVTSVIASPSEPVYILNIKRGIISSFAVDNKHESDEDVVETDVHGTCHVNYEVDGNTIETHKDISRCRVPSRHDWNLSPSSLAWNLTFFQFFMSQARTDCKYELGSGSIKKIECHEKIGRKTGVTPDSPNGVYMNIHQTLVFTTMGTDRTGFQTSGKTTGIAFEWEPKPEPTSQPQNFVNKALKLVDDIANTAELEIRVLSVELFDKLVDLLRESSDVVDFTKKVYGSRYRSGTIQEEVARSLTRDALVTCNTAPCMKGVSFLATKGHLSRNYLNVLLFKFTKLRITNPAYVDEILAICKSNPTRMCLLSLSAIIHNYLYHNKDLENPQISQGIRDSVSYISSFVGNDCDPSKVNRNLEHSERVERIILALKAFGNLGDAGTRANPNLVQTLQKCAESRKLPANATLEAIKAFRRISSNDQIYKFLLGIVRKQDNSIENRVAAYLVLSSHHHEPRLYEDIAAILEKETDQQLTNFVTLHMTNVQSYGDSSLDALKASMRAAASNHENVFAIKGHRRLTSSRHRQRAFYFNSPYVSELINRFGYDASSLALHEPDSFLPHELMANLTTVLFSKTFNTATLNAAMHGLEPYLEALFGPQGIFKDRAKLKSLLQDAQTQGAELMQRLQDPVGYMSQDWVPHFEKSVEDKLDQIHNSVIMEYGKEQPSATFSLKLYGDELAFTSLDLIKDRLLTAIESLGTINWEEPHKYHVHRMIRFLEGYSQLPTIAGLPFTLKANGNLGISIRASVKADIFGLLNQPPFLNAEWDINGSGVLSAIGSMTVEVPGFARVGFQGNNTIYRSRQRAGDLSYADGELTINRKVAPRPQQVFNYFRDNRIIRGNNYEDFPDYNVQRVNTDSCYSGFLGLKYCRAKNYASSAAPDRAEIFLLGDIDYRIFFESDDPGLKAYTFKLNRQIDGTTRKYDVHFEAPGTKGRREINGFLSRNRDTNEFEVSLQVPEKPHIKLHAKRTKNDDGYLTHVDAQFREGRPVTFHAESHVAVESKKDKSGKTISSQVKEIKAHLNLPERKYSWSRTYSEYGINKEIDHYFTYESKSESYMNRILPDIFWETPTKAKAHLHIDVDYDLDAGFERHTSNYIELPKSRLEIETQRIRQLPDRRSLHVNVTRRELPSRNVLSFINFVYDMTNTPSGDENTRTHLVQLSIPKTRWTVSTKRDFGKVHNKIHAELKREHSTDDTQVVTDASPKTTWNAIFTLNHKNVSAERGAVYPAPRERELDFTLDYPRDGARHQIKYTGKLINNEAQENAIRSFKTDSNIELTYWKYSVKANTDYTRTSEKIKLDHNSAITSGRTGRTATYKAHVDANLGFPVEISQEFKSSFLTYDQKLTAVKTGAGKGDLNFVIKAHSDVWDGLNIDFQQTVNYDRQGLSTEKVHFSHKLVDIDVQAEFRMPLGSHYKKTFDIKSKNQVWPSFKVIIDHHDNTYYSARVEYPDDPEGKNVYGVVEVDPNYKGFELVVSHDKRGIANQTVIEYSLHIVNPKVFVVKRTMDVDALKRVAKVYAERFRKTFEAWQKIKSDPNHPMNKILQPIVKTTLADFQAELKERSQARRKAIREALVEAIDSLEPIYGPTVSVIRGLCAGVERLILIAEDRPQTYVGSYFKNYNVRERVREYLIKLADRLSSRLSTFRSADGDRSLVVNHPFYWNSLLEIPRASPRLHRLLDRQSRRQPRPILDRVAVLYGADHVYTFDGKTYSFPGFVNKECSFLLAHDFVFRKYSILIQDGYLHALFPDIALSVDKSGNVRVNGSKTAEDLPLRSYGDHVAAEASPGHSVHIHTDYGLDIEVYPQQGFFVFYLDYWNHNRTLGLLGNNDNEPLNDFKTLNGKIAKDVYELLKEYELSGRNICVDKKKLQGKKPCTRAFSADCSNIFDKENSKSPLYKCFDIVDPEPFQSTCQSDTQCGANMCDSISAYGAVCATYDVHLKISGVCDTYMRANNPGHCDEDAHWEVQGDKAVETVFVINENDKDGSQHLKGVETLVDALERVYKKNGYSAKYGLVSYRDGRPFAHTVKRQGLLSAKDLNEALKSISFEDGGHSCALDALDLAGEVYFTNPRASRNIILVTPNDMHAQVLFGNRRDVANAFRCLDGRGITLYTISNYDEVPLSKKAYGIRGDGTLISQTKKGNEQVTYPKGMYAKLSAGTRGTVYHATYLSSGDGKFFTEIANEAAARVGKEAGKAKKCHCHADKVIFTEPVCRSTEY